ncbi:AAA family ATPase [Nonomuraea sp. NPDC050404]|uniref:helix-turn-helix transcriptional regulator n=1 Tax=Nonomuraea sp. NPDC050404 TaxID=3155783 RepID=UPI00340B5AEB
MPQRITCPVLVGREAELRRLREAVERARSGAASVVVVAGEAGVGKSRLVGELVRAAEGVRALVGGCLDVAAEVALAPLVEALRSLQEWPDPAERERVVGPAREELARLLPGLGEASAVAPEPGRLYELVLGVLHRMAEHGPVLFVVEDLHWADRSTRDLVGFLARNLRAGVALVLTYRNDEVPRGHPLRGFLAELVRGGGVDRVELGRLERRDLRRLLAGILDDEPTPELLDLIWARSAGNAFFAEELVAAWAGEAVGAGKAGGAGGVSLPGTLLELLLARVETLGERTRAVLEAAAVAPGRIDHDALARVTGADDVVLEEALREAVDRHMLVVDGEDGYAFRHGLLREAIEGDLLPRRRRALHSAWARALTVMTDADPGLLAHHWHAAGDLEQALPASVRAGQAAEESGTAHEARRHYLRALDLWPKAPRAAAGSPPGRAALLERAARMLAITGSPGEAIALIEQALQETGEPHAQEEADGPTSHALEEADRPMSRALEEVGEPTSHSLEEVGGPGALLERLARYRWLDGDSEGAVSAVARALDVIRPEPSVLRARVLAAHGQILMIGGRNAAAAERCEEAIAVAVRVGARAEQGHALATLGTALAALGDVATGEARLREAYALAEDAEQRCRALHNLSYILVRDGRCAEAVDVALECHALAARSGILRSVGVTALANGVEALVCLGRWEEAERLLEEIFDLGPRPAALPAPLTQRGLLRFWRGDLDGARADADTAVRATDPQLSEPARALLAMAATWQGRPLEARAAISTPPVDDPEYVIGPCLAGLEAEAAIAEQALAAHDDAAHEAACVQAGDLIGRVRAASAGRVSAPVAAMVLTAEAQRSRVTGRPNPQLWAEAADAWEALGFPGPAAHARWRQTEALLNAGISRDHATPVLRKAHALARTVPLVLAEVEALSRRARIGVSTAADAGEDAATSRITAPFGLTPREREVLAMVADGHTNRQIAGSLFISAKTASVHVSNILSKLGVTNRAEAAVAAHRLGLTDA